MKQDSDDEEVQSESSTSTENSKDDVTAPPSSSGFGGFFKSSLNKLRSKGNTQSVKTKGDSANRRCFYSCCTESVEVSCKTVEIYEICRFTLHVLEMSLSLCLSSIL